MELLAERVDIQKTGQEFTFFNLSEIAAVAALAVGRVVARVELAQQDPAAVVQHDRQ